MQVYNDKNSSTFLPAPVQVKNPSRDLKTAGYSGNCFSLKHFFDTSSN
jgi:hypothetical protein